MDTLGRHVLLFGGSGPDAAFYGDAWVWRGSTWTRLHNPSSPEPRTGVALRWDPPSGAILLFGGYLRTDSSEGFFDDTWVLATQT